MTIATMMRTTSLILLLLSSTVTAFVVNHPRVANSHKNVVSSTTTTTTSTLLRMSEAEAVVTDPFASYKKGDLNSVVTKDLTTGSGDPLEDGNTIKLWFKGYILETAKMFEEGDLIFKAGPEGRGMQAFKDGVKGMRLGGKRLIRIPSKDAYGERGSKKIPPNADLEFEVEILEIKTNPVEAFLLQYDLGNNPRTYGLLACFAVLALTPLLPQ